MKLNNIWPLGNLRPRRNPSTMTAMRGLALCLVAGAIAVTGCGGSDNNASAPKQQKVTASGGSSGQPAAVSAKGPATPNSLCTDEGKGKPKKQCVKALGKLNKGKAANPKAACKGLSKKKTKGVRGKSPFAVCVTAAAKLMASKSAGSGGGNGAADSNSGSGSSGSGDGSDASDSSSGNDTSEQDGIVCHDDKGNVVPIDDDNVADCDIPDNGSSASDSSADSSSADDTSTDSSDDGN